MATAFDVSRWFLKHESMTHKKLQKLCYYAQAWYCALRDGTPLFEDEIQAWVHGPVVASMYPIYAPYKWELIPKYEGEVVAFDDSTLDVLEAVYDTYGEFSGDQLERLTHSEEPWVITRGELKPWETCTKAIPCGLMREYYGKKYEQGQGD